MADDPSQSDLPPSSDGEESVLRQEEIEALLRSAGRGGPSAKAASGGAAAGASSAAAPAATSNVSSGPASGVSGGVPASRTRPAAGPSPGAGNDDEERIAPGDVEYLLQKAQEALASVDQPASSEIEGLAAYRLQEFTGAAASTEIATLELIRDVELDLRIELGRTEMYLEDVLKLRKGSVVPLDKLAGDPVDVYVNGRLVARGEVLVLNDNFCVRISELVAGHSVRPA